MAFLLKSLDIMMCGLSQILLYNVGEMSQPDV